MSELAAGLAATSNEPVAESPATPDSVLDAVFESPSEPAAGSEPSETPPPAEPPVAATQQPQATVDPSGAKGEPPRERWDSILENARTKAAQGERERVLSEYVDPKTGMNLIEVAQALRGNFTGTLAQLAREAAEHPDGGQVVSALEAILAARTQAAKADAEPEADLQTADGALVYSADQLRKWHQWNQTQTEKKLTAQFAPLQQLQERFEQHQQAQTVIKEVADVTEKRGALWKAMPHFTEHQQAIVSRQAEIYAEMQGQPGFDPMGSPWEALQRAYTEVITTQAIPKLRSAQTGQFMADAARKRAGSSSDPAASAPAQPRKPRTVDEALNQVFDGVGV